jgi:hypothetical protein
LGFLCHHGNPRQPKLTIASAFDPAAAQLFALSGKAVACEAADPVLEAALELVDWANANCCANPDIAVPTAKTTPTIARVLVILFMRAYIERMIVYTSHSG